MEEKKKVCAWCRRSGKHLECCPHDNALCQQIWHEGRKAAFEGHANMHSDDPTYTLGFVQGDMDRETVTNPPSREHVRPSLTEVIMAQNEIRKPIPTLPPPHLARTGEEFDAALLSQAEGVIY